MRYTLYCEYGHNGRPGKHYLYIGGWIHPPHSVVLCHGTLTEEEWDAVNVSGYCVLVDNVHNHTVEVRKMSEGRTARWIHSRNGISTYNICGILQRVSDKMYAGDITLHGI